VQLFGRPASAQIRFSITNNTPDEVEYTIGDQGFTLPPRYTRTHKQCRESELKFAAGDVEAAASAMFTVTSGATYVVTESGKVQVEQAPVQAAAGRMP
jgi:hypothetical protein